REPRALLELDALQSETWQSKMPNTCGQKPEEDNQADMETSQQDKALRVEGKVTKKLGHVPCDKGSGNYPQSPNCSRREHGTRSTSEGWLSGGRRQGYGYEFVSEFSEEGETLLWKRAHDGQAGPNSDQ